MSYGDTFVTSKRAGYLLGKSARTVQRMADSGELPLVQKLPGINGAYLFRLADVERVAAAQIEEAKVQIEAMKARLAEQTTAGAA